MSVTGLRATLYTALAERYRVERELGAGGMATVYLAEDVRRHRKVALEVLHPELSAVLGPERFLKEIELTANLGARERRLGDRCGGEGAGPAMKRSRIARLSTRDRSPLVRRAAARGVAPTATLQATRPLRWAHQ